MFTSLLKSEVFTFIFIKEIDLNRGCGNLIFNCDIFRVFSNLKKDINLRKKRGKNTLTLLNIYIFLKINAAGVINDASLDCLFLIDFFHFKFIDHSCP